MGSCKVLCQIFDPAELEHGISNATNILQSSNAKFRTQRRSDCVRFDKLLFKYYSASNLSKRTQSDVRWLRNFAFELCRMFDGVKISCLNSAGSNIWHNTLQDPI